MYQSGRSKKTQSGRSETLFNSKSGLSYEWSFELKVNGLNDQNRPHLALRPSIVILLKNLVEELELLMTDQLSSEDHPLSSTTVHFGLSPFTLDLTKNPTEKPTENNLPVGNAK